MDIRVFFGGLLFYTYNRNARIDCRKKHTTLYYLPYRIYYLNKTEKLSAMDVLARASMKDAAKCDTHCELQISVNHQISERIWRCGDFPAARLFQCLLNYTSNTPPPEIKKIVTTGLTFVSENCCLQLFLDGLRYFLGVDIYDGVVV